MNKAKVTSPYEFWTRKVEWFQQCWWNERHTDEEFVRNMVLMGFEEDYIRSVSETT